MEKKRRSTRIVGIFVFFLCMGMVVVSDDCGGGGGCVVVVVVVVGRRTLLAGFVKNEDWETVAPRSIF